MSRIRLFESRGLSEADRLAGLHQEMVTPLARVGRWRRERPHVENHAVLIWIPRGQGRITTLAKTRGYAPATAIVLPPRTPFAIQPGAMTEGSLTRLPDLFEAPMPSEPRTLRVSDMATQGELSGLLDRLGRAGDLADPPTGRAALARVILLSALVERIDRLHPDRPRNAADRLAAAFARAVEDRLCEGLRLEDMAGLLDVTPTHLTRTIRATCGITAARYMSERVMHEARRRLADTDDSAATIAAALGFGSAAYFTRAFGRVTGETPSAFRKRERRVAVASPATSRPDRGPRSRAIV
ncbi:helix-turn-helix domain-containing protein [Jannaschia ovalis]|uniref:AraC family transcriptional regulator n=1 Tax=Jannaschia ovalis TaxID=3038773 RepID=A0ABY8LC94_9RHOB|nr:AraC family transcriptional regulator [Jannaschia sp. GRR-S6-38]WGH78751.1 AraC family transcriptional regulator [Jannaschia sp. GRR-S6-38]